MKRVTGIGGIFFKALDPSSQRAWYRQHLEIDVQEWGGATFDWLDASGNPTNGATTWCIGSAEDHLFDSGRSLFMINYRVEDLTSLLTALRAEGCNVIDRTEVSQYGKFGWVIDPEGNKIELWQPVEGA